MAIQENGPAPYAPPSSVINVIERFRDRGLSTPFTLEVLQRAGVSEALAPRTLQALKLLDLINEDGEPTEEMMKLRMASTEDFKPRLAAVVRAAYAPVFAFAKPDEDPPERIRDAFRVFNPVGQQQRMLMLFMNLCQYAGIIEERQPLPRPRESKPRVVTAKATGRGHGSSKAKGGVERLDVLPAGGHALTPVSQGVIFGVTDADIATLTEAEFQEVWAALGKVARARSRPKPELVVPAVEEKEQDVSPPRGYSGEEEEVSE